MTILSGLAFQPIGYDVPEGKPTNAKAVNVGVMKWSADSAFIIDPSQSNQLLEMQNMQSAFIDNYNSTGTTLLTVAGTGHTIRIPPKSQAYLPLIAGDRPVITISNTSGNGTTQVWLLNVPALGVVWTLP